MPYYYPLKKLKNADLRLRTVEGLQRLRKQLKDERFPSKKTSESLILGTWNLRNFDDDRFNYGPRLYESFYYIAEIINHFDVIAIQEICTDLWPLKRVMNILDKDYDYIVTDVTHSSIGGNQERLGFIYNKSKVTFTGIAGEIVLPPKLMISEVASKKRQFARTPFGVDFQSGWFKFFFSTVHIFFGSNSPSSPKYQRRVQEIEAVAKYIAKEAKHSDSNHILVGDFNIKKAGSAGFNALEKNGFTVVTNNKGSNRDQTKFYDQISFRSKKNELAFLEPERKDRVIQFFNSIFRDEDYGTYKPIMKERIADKLKTARAALKTATSKTAKKKLNNQIASLTAARKTDASLRAYYDEWRTFQASDHLPLWVEIKIDFSDQYLEKLKVMDNQ
ncbi:endonuclease/exonuclease/phosphatase family protein [Ulvibacterium marinum]|uniref:endonuclease/exonuclease/phosphatase family protein n=1 Tax=Ulvibacterium marinum TaxID=2419782 RepID=UPI002494BA9A|nr:endonuclease/exonuclease/phosphatase family protein [Ulvibacterium marinum]